jgi:hypothetical protein
MAALVSKGRAKAEMKNRRIDVSEICRMGRKNPLIGGKLREGRVIWRAPPAL